jgi:hypothetical protein
MHVDFQEKKIYAKKKRAVKKKQHKNIYSKNVKIVDVPKLCIRITHKYKKKKL